MVPGGMGRGGTRGASSVKKDGASHDTLLARKKELEDRVFQLTNRPKPWSNEERERDVLKNELSMLCQVVGLPFDRVGEVDEKLKELLDERDREERALSAECERAREGVVRAREQLAELRLRERVLEGAQGGCRIVIEGLAGMKGSVVALKVEIERAKENMMKRFEHERVLFGEASRQCREMHLRKLRAVQEERATAEAELMQVERELASLDAQARAMTELMRQAADAAESASAERGRRRANADASFRQAGEAGITRWDRILAAFEFEVQGLLVGLEGRVSSLMRLTERVRALVSRGSDPTNRQVPEVRERIVTENLRRLLAHARQQQVLDMIATAVESDLVAAATELREQLEREGTMIEVQGETMTRGDIRREIIRLGKQNSRHLQRGEEIKHQIEREIEAMAELAKRAADRS